jgi:hypothetical protein
VRQWLLAGIFSNQTAEMNIAVTHNDTETNWCPVLFFDKCGDMVANVIVVESRIGDVEREFRNRLKKIGSRYDPNKLISAHDRETLDIIVFHKPACLNQIKRRLRVMNARRPRVPQKRTSLGDRDSAHGRSALTPQADIRPVV